MNSEVNTKTLGVRVAPAAGMTIGGHVHTSPATAAEHLASLWACRLYSLDYLEFWALRSEVSSEFIARRYPEQQHKAVIRCPAFHVWWNRCWSAREPLVQHACKYQLLTRGDSGEDQYRKEHLDAALDTNPDAATLAAIKHSIQRERLGLLPSYVTHPS